MFGLLVEDLDGDGYEDILLGGNFHRAKPEVGIHDASYGLFLRGDGRGDFTPEPARESGFFVKGEMRDIVSLKVNGDPLVVVAKNNEPLEVFSVGRESLEQSSNEKEE